METARTQTAASRLFVTTSVENKDELEEKLERSYQFLQSIVAGLSDKDAHEALNRTLLKDKAYEDVSLGLLVAVLSDPQGAARSYRDLTLITRDGFGLILANLTQLVGERYLKFNEVTKNQLIWLLREMIKNAVNGVDNLCWNLMRHAAGGDVSQRNLSLIESLLDVFIDYRTWLEKFPFLIASVVYNYLRLIEDHNGANLRHLRDKEVEFVVSLLRDKFTECLVIGRDLLRLLQNVARIPPFEQLWKDLLLNPKTLSANFTGILQLLQTRTSRRFLQSRLTPEMEKKLVFLTAQVRFGNHKRYQDWFQRQYLATPESQTLRCDIIRFIVGVIHPSNELLGSDVIPRWAVIGWLLTTCTSAVAVSNAKLALFYDWLFFDHDRDNIMNIEPAILVMHHSMRSHPAISATLLDFLCRIIANFYPPLTEKVRSGIFNSLRHILDKRVLPSLLPLFDNPKLDRELRVMVRDTFKEFFTMPCPETSLKQGNADLFDEDDEQRNHRHHQGLDHQHHTTSSTATVNHEPAFSDDEDDPTSVCIPPIEVATASLDDVGSDDDDDDDIPLSEVRLKKIDGGTLDGPIGDALSKLEASTAPFDVAKRCDYTTNLIKHVLELDPDDETLPLIARGMSNVIKEDLKDEILPATITDEALVQSVRSPLFILYKALYSMTKDDPGKATIHRLLAEMSNYTNNLGFLLLYYLKTRIRTENKKEDQTKASALKISVYKDYCQCVADKKIERCLYDDLRNAHLLYTRSLMWIVPDLYRDLKQQTLNNGQILHVILSSIDSRQFQTLVGKVLQGHLVMFRAENVQPLIKTSLDWESIEQFFFWQLIDAHDISIDAILPLIVDLDYDHHSEALTAIMLMLKQEKPNADYIRCLFSRELSGDNNDGDLFVFTIIKYWCDEYIDKVAELIAALLSTRYPSTSPHKRKRTAAGAAKSSADGGAAAAVPTSDHVLSHLERLRVVCERHDCMAIYTLDSMQRALNVAHSNSSDAQKRQFGELFALMEDEEEEEISATSKRTHGRGRKGKPAPAAAATKRPPPPPVRDSPFSDESSEDEEIVKPKQAKKRKKVMSDSD